MKKKKKNYVEKIFPCEKIKLIKNANTFEMARLCATSIKKLQKNQKNKVKTHYYTGINSETMCSTVKKQLFVC